MKTVTNFIIGLIVMAVLHYSGAPNWAAIGFAITAFYIYAAADYVVVQIKDANAKDKAT